MKIRIPKTIAEPHTLRWNEVVCSQEVLKSLVTHIRKSLHVSCKSLMECGVATQLSNGGLLSILKDIAEDAGGRNVSTGYKKVRDSNGKITGVRYHIGFKVSSKDFIRYGWTRRVLYED